MRAVFAGGPAQRSEVPSAIYEELWSINIGVILIELAICAPIMERIKYRLLIIMLTLLALFNRFFTRFRNPRRLGTGIYLREDRSY